jgi:phosphatidylglycerophosphate synthase
MVLDGVDGQVARRTRSATAFGARFDMELDSLLMLVLAALVWRSGQVGPWVLLLGLPRYLFVAAGRLRPWLRAPLPERVRRKAGCVIQGIALLVCLGPIVPSGLATVVAALTLALLVSSFAVDVVWLSTRPK